MPIINYSSPFVPAEWIAAHGLTPRRVVLGAADCTDTVAEACAYARQVAAAASDTHDAAAVIVGATCDQMRRAAEDAVADARMPVFIMHVPATWQTDTARALFDAELGRMSRLLERCGGTAPSPDALRTTMQTFDAARARLHAARASMAPRTFAAALLEFHETNAVGELKTCTAEPRGVPIALLGGPLLREHYALWNAIEAAGGFVALDATENGERTLPAPFSPDAMADNPRADLVRAYFDTIPDMFRRPDTLLHAWLANMVRARGVRGIVCVRHTWCDHWHAEIARVKESLGLPVLDLELQDHGPGNDTRALSRLQAFMESRNLMI